MNFLVILVLYIKPWFDLFADNIRGRFFELLHQGREWIDTVPLAFLLTPVIYSFEKYIIADWDSFSLVMATLIGDTAFGVYKHWRKGTLGKEGFGKFVDKLMVCFFALFLSEKLGAIGDLALWQDIAHGFGRASLIVYLGMSIAENMSDITNGKFPPKSVLDRFKIFNEKKNNDL